MPEKEILSREFYERDPKIVAINLLGKILVRVLDGRTLSSMIVGTVLTDLRMLTWFLLKQ